MRDLARRPSNWRATDGLDGYLRRHRVSGIAGIDTRRLTRHLRDAGAIPGAFGTADERHACSPRRADGGTDGCDLANEVTTDRAVRRRPARRAVLRRRLRLRDQDVDPAPARRGRLPRRGRARVDARGRPSIARAPDGVFLSNGPGDPAAVDGAVRAVGELLGEVPVFGICLGHQIMCLALGARTFKLRFGHHGANHPVRRVETGRVEITSQNHNYAVDGDSLPAGSVVTHVNLNDGDIEGVKTPDRRCFSVQYHPEAGPGPHDARYLFGEFLDLMREAS